MGTILRMFFVGLAVVLGGCARHERTDFTRPFVHSAPEEQPSDAATLVGRDVIRAPGPQESLSGSAAAALRLGPENSVSLLRAGEPTWRDLPTLGPGRRPHLAAFHGGVVYVIAEHGSATRLLTLKVDGGEWNDRGAVPVELKSAVALAIQTRHGRAQPFLFSESDGTLGVAAFDPQSSSWTIGPRTVAIEGGVLATPSGLSNIVVIPRRGGPALTALNTTTLAWLPRQVMTWPGEVRAISMEQTTFRALSVDGDGRIWLTRSDYRPRASGLHPADYAVIVGCAVLLVGIALLNSRRYRSAESYFRGGKQIPWLAAGLSVVATGQSATSFISLPARAFSTAWQFGLVPLTNVFGALIMSRFFVRFFVRLNITSAYEYLEVRFSPLVRTIGSINYLAYELARISLLILVPAVAISAVTRLDLTVAIMMIGAVATIYTTSGGLEGVVWADVVQVSLKIAAIIAVIVIIFSRLEGSFTELGALAWREGKLRMVDWSFDLTRESIGAILLFWLTDGLKSYVANQTIIQRFVSTRDERAAQRSIGASAVAGTLIFWTFLLAGTGLYLFYLQNPGRFDLAMDKTDAVFPWFIVFELPPGVAGLLITALLGAALSSLYGALNSTSTVMVTDFYRRFAAATTDAGALRLGRGLTLAVGVVATALSLVLSGLASRSLVEQTLSFIGLFGGGLGGLFLAGMLTTRVSARSALVGFVVSGIVQYFVSRHTSLSWLTYMFTGMGSCIAAAWLASFVWREEKPLDGLTVHTCER